jgi:hypothetical protein
MNPRWRQTWKLEAKIKKMETKEEYKEQGVMTAL